MKLAKAIISYIFAAASGVLFLAGVAVLAEK